MKRGIVELAPEVETAMVSPPEIRRGPGRPRKVTVNG